MRSSRLRPLLLSLATVAFSASARAETYRVDLIVFLNPGSAVGETGEPLAAPNLRGSLEPDDIANLRAAGIEVLPEAQFALTDQYQHLRWNKQFRPLFKIAWTQKDPPQERGPSIHLKIPGATPDAPPLVDGSIALLLSRYLHLDVDLAYQQDDQRWMLDERRRMRRDEVHHLDSAKIGVLAEVSKPGGGPGTDTEPGQ